MKKQLTLLSFLILVLASCIKPKDGDVVNADVCGVETDLELALTNTSRQLGYMNREKAPVKNEGMIFVFDEEAPREFWMKSVKFPLDILFIDKDFTVFKTWTMYPEPGVPSFKLKRYPSGVGAQYAIEFRENWAKENNIQLGCKIKLSDKITTN